jgi:hypothetical protein
VIIIGGFFSPRVSNWTGTTRQKKTLYSQGSAQPPSSWQDSRPVAFSSALMAFIPGHAFDELIEQEAVRRSKLPWDLYTNPGDVAFAYLEKRGLNDAGRLKAAYRTAQQAYGLGAFVLRFPSADAAAALEPEICAGTSSLPYMLLPELRHLQVPLPPRTMLQQSKKMGGVLLLTGIAARRGLLHFRWQWSLLHSSKNVRLHTPLPADLGIGPQSQGGVVGFLLTLGILPFDFNRQRLKLLCARLEQWRGESAPEKPFPADLRAELAELREEIAWDAAASQVVEEHLKRRRSAFEFAGLPVPPEDS